MSNVLIIGGGPAGLMAAWAASQRGHQVQLFEKNEQLGKKLQLTGHGRCNITNRADRESFFDHIVHNAKFLYSAFSQFSNVDMLTFLHSHGLPTIEEEAGRIFPASQDARDVVLLFVQLLKENGVSIHTNEAVLSLKIQDKHCLGIHTTEGFYTGDTTIVTTGGLSFPMTGSQGDGLQWAKEAGLHLNETYPGLVSIHTKEKITMPGLSLQNIGIQVLRDNKRIFQTQGDLLFTHLGLSGPAILNASSAVVLKKPTSLVLDLVPSMPMDTLDQTLIQAMANAPNKALKTIFEKMLPASLVQYILAASSIAPEQKAHQTTKEQRRAILQNIKALPFNIQGFGSFQEAMITVGGIHTKEIHPKTMASKQIQGLCFAGEILDIDGQTGGYNLQIAWSTGYCAGANI